jgi:glutamate-ammonia-ligase adenylyltransferase
VWEHQALVRARPVAGDPALMRAAAEVRQQLLATPRDTAALREKVRDMRERWRTQLDRSTAERFDLKQGRGGLVDLEFCLQYLVLRDAAATPALAQVVRTRDLIAALAGAGTIAPEIAAALTAAHAALLGAALDATLNGAPRVVRADAAVQGARDAVLQFAEALGLPVARTGACR